MWLFWSFGCKLCKQALALLLSRMGPPNFQEKKPYFWRRDCHYILQTPIRLIRLINGLTTAMTSPRQETQWKGRSPPGLQWCLRATWVAFKIPKLDYLAIHGYFGIHLYGLKKNNVQPSWLGIIMIIAYVYIYIHIHTRIHWHTHILTYDKLCIQTS